MCFISKLVQMLGKLSICIYYNRLTYFAAYFFVVVIHYVVLFRIIFINKFHELSDCTTIRPKNSYPVIVRPFTGSLNCGA